MWAGKALWQQFQATSIFFFFLLFFFVLRIFVNLKKQEVTEQGYETVVCFKCLPWINLPFTENRRSSAMIGSFYLKFLKNISYLLKRLPCGLAGKESACDVGDLDSIPGLGRSPGEGKGYPLQYSGLENFMNCIVHGVAKSRTGLNDFHFHFFIKRTKLCLTYNVILVSYVQHSGLIFLYIMK